MICPTVQDTWYLMQTSRALRWKAALDSQSRAQFLCHLGLGKDGGMMGKDGKVMDGTGQDRTGQDRTGQDGTGQYTTLETERPV
jgi:hypothetical protein